MSDFPATLAPFPLEASAPQGPITAPRARSAARPASAPPADAGQAPAGIAAPLPATPSLPLAAILRRLAHPIPPQHISQKKVPTKKGSSYSADFVHHATVRDLLDHRAPGWEWCVRLTHAGGLLYVVGTLTVHGTDGSVARDGIGNEADGLDGYGDPSSNAEAQALRRAAMALGLGRALWRK